MATGDMDGNRKDEMIIAFGSKYGIWVGYNNIHWVKLHWLSAE
jgi:hypothetical protein